MPPEEKPVVTGGQEPVGAGAPPATDPQVPAADHQSNFLESLSEEGKSYLKGLGIESLDQDNFAKIIESSIKQKSSVSDKSRELEELRAQLTSQGKPIEPARPAEPAAPATPPVSEVTPQEPSTPAGRGVSENDLFDLSTMINTQFPELVDEAADGRLFAELRQLGFFGVEGINKKQVFDHLTQKHNLAKELKELREFRAQHQTPDEADNPTYNHYGVINDPITKDAAWARQVIAASINGAQIDAKDVNEARSILQKAI